MRSPRGGSILWRLDGVAKGLGLSRRAAGNKSVLEKTGGECPKFVRWKPKEEDGAMKTGKLARLGGALLVLAMLLWAQVPAVMAGGKVVPVEETAGRGMLPDFELVDAMDGGLVKSEVFRDKVLLVVFWATWCPPCLQEIPDLIKMQEKYGKDGFSVIGMSIDRDGRDKVKKLAEKMQINYPVLMAEPKVARGFGGVSGVPTAFLVGHDGKVIRRLVGYQDHSAVTRLVEAELAKK